MAETSNGSGGDGKELSMEKRLLLAFILMGAVLFLTPYFYTPDPPAQRPAAEQTSAAPTQTPDPVPAAAPETAPEMAAPAVEAAAPSSEAVSAQAEETHVIETDVYRIEFSNRGAVVKSWALKDYGDREGNPLELVNPVAVEGLGYPFHIEFTGNAPPLDPNSGLFTVKKLDDGRSIEFELSDGVTRYRKTFRFRRGQYLGDVTSEAFHNGQPIPHLLVWRGGFGDTSIPNASTLQHSLFYNLADAKLVVNDPDEAEDGPITLSGPYSFAGLEDAYFAAVALPKDGGTFTIRTFSDLLPAGEDAKQLPHVGAGVGGAGSNVFPLFVGPKDLDILKSIDPKLQELVDFGWFAILAKPIFMALKWTHNNVVANWGWSIVLLTLIINLLTLPLKYTSMKSMKRMQVLQPEIKKIQDKYKGLSMRDPKKQSQNEELMKLYKQHNVNPMGGCLPMALQIPFFFAFYKVLNIAIELRGAEWLWVTDLSQPETIPIRVLPLAMIISQFAMQKLTPTTTTNPGQQRIMYLMPLMMGFIFYGVSSGLVLYWLTSNVVGAGQQQLMNRFGKSDDVVLPPAPETKPKKKARKR